MPFKPVPIWKEAPFLRLIIPFMLGITAQWYLQPPINVSIITFWSFAILYTLFQFSKNFILFRLYWLNGIFMNTFLLLLGSSLTYYTDLSHHPDHITRYYKTGDVVMATLLEPLSEKEKIFKALASVDYVESNDSLHPVKSSILLYFKKDSSLLQLSYGSQIAFNKPLQGIKNSGNPGAFDYERYCAFQGIYYQAFLKPDEFEIMKEKNENAITKFLFIAQEKTVSIFQKYIPGNKEKGFAEALLIGYKDDLDKNLVQSYTNTGVVHIIAISGMQLALIYGLLVVIFKPFSKFRFIKFLRPVTIISILWLFSLMSGASASVLRAAVMLTCIVIGESFSKKTSIYNNLAASAFLLLCYNPFWLWDVGFQLSYSAVLSIVIFMKPIYNLIYIQNKILDFAWQLTAVTLSAQILTTPISIFHFHQFPNYFLFTNLIAVPLSSIILFGELFLCAVSFIPVVAKSLGFSLYKLIWLLNSFIERTETLPVSLWDNLQITFLQLIAIYAFIISISHWLMMKKKKYLPTGLIALLAFTGLRSYSFWQASTQKKMIVYNVPQHQAIDFISGRNYFFKGDSILEEDGFLRSFHLKPSRTMHRISETDSLNDLDHGYHIFQFGNKRILILDQDILFAASQSKMKADVIIISKNPSLKISNLADAFDCKRWVFDASNSNYKVAKWKKECEQLGLFCYDVVDKGAFVMNAD
ncbi:MAG TPA: ComEC/Rec2 family competence protein [Puia sp.]|nr:ComEC/Rec2 family competence protein [Puia sp.]